MFSTRTELRWAPLGDRLDDELDGFHQELRELQRLPAVPPSTHGRSQSRMVATHRFSPTGAWQTTEINWHTLTRSLRLATRYSRLVDPALSLAFEAPVVLVRSGCILFSVSDELLSVKAIIAHDELLLFVPASASPPPPRRRQPSRLTPAADDPGPDGPLPMGELAAQLQAGLAEWAADAADADATPSCAFACAALEILLDAFTQRLDGAVHAVAASAGAVRRAASCSTSAAPPHKLRLQHICPYLPASARRCCASCASRWTLRAPMTPSTR